MPIWIWMIPQYVQWPTPITYLYLFHAFVIMLYTSMTDALYKQKIGYIFPFSGKPGQKYLEEADLGQVPMWWPILYTCCGPLCSRCWLPCSSGCSHPMPVDLVYLRSAHLYLRRLDGQTTYHQIYFYILNLTYLSTTYLFYNLKYLSFKSFELLSLYRALHIKEIQRV